MPTAAVARRGEQGTSARRDERTGFYPGLTDLRAGGNPVLRNVCPMTPQLTPASGSEDNVFEDNVFPPARRTSNGALTMELHDDLGVWPGESDPTRMLSAVLLLVIATVTMALALAWWLI
ncbi:MAG: hypothetical protein JO272_10290 [Pseudonocardiales bacterium]|nr:hypothetical protein [Pseudonocardiales bacterium]